MSWREPEYIDDEEFYDADGAANVLGGSGSRVVRDDYDEAAADARKRSNKGARPKAARARNPAPSVASSEERRARLAGKHTPGKSRKDKPEPAPVR